MTKEEKIQYLIELWEKLGIITVIKDKDEQSKEQGAVV